MSSASGVEKTDPSFPTASGPDASASSVAAAAKRSGAIELLESLINQEISETRVAITEETVRKLWNFYLIDSDTEILSPHDVRQFLLDLLQAFKWPLVVPDESLDAVFAEMSLNERGAISWPEFKSFFQFLHDRPLHKLFQLTANSVTREQLGNARLALFQYAGDHPASVAAVTAESEADADADAATVASSSASSVPPSSADDSSGISPDTVSLEARYDRTPYERYIMDELLPNTDRVFVYFISDRAALVLCISDRYVGPLSEPIQMRISLESGGEEGATQPYIVSIQAFDVTNDVFPPMRRFGGFGSKVARRIADTYVSAKTWDETHLRIADRTSKFARRASETLAKFDADYKVSEQFNQATKQASDSVKAFDEKHKISSTITATTKSLDEKYKISERTDEAVKKIQANETVKSVTASFASFLSGVRRSAETISSETRQLVTEKERERATKAAADPSLSAVPSEMRSAAGSDPSSVADVVADADIVGGTVQAPRGEDSDEDVD